MTFREYLSRYKYLLLTTICLLLAVYSSIISAMARQWLDDGNYSHGFLIPLIAGYFVWKNSKALMAATVEPWNPGLLVIIFGVCQLLLGYLAGELFTMRSSFVVVLIGVSLYLFGGGVFRILRLPLLYLILMVPIPYIIYNSIAFPLKLFVTRMSVGILKLLGIAVIREGNIIMLPSVVLEVADACSGMRSLVSLLAIAVSYAFLIQTTTAKRWLIVVSAVPIAIMTNSFRVIFTGILAQYWSEKAAQDFFHEFTGMVVFVISMMLLVGIGAALRKEGDL